MNQCLHVHQLTIGHSQQHSVVKNINLTIETGEIWCILGANGSGKSTLLRTLAGILKPLSGTVLLNGNPLWKMSGKQKAKQIAFVAQHKSNPLEFTIEELFNLYKSGDHGFFKSKIESTEHKQTTRTPKNLLNEMGLDCDLQTAFHKLSGGQQQIVRLALAIIQDSQFLILDEPTASLDIAHAHIVATHIQRIAKQQKGVILSTHDPQLANQLNANLVLLKNGHILAQGPANVVLNDANLSKLYNTPVACIPTAHGLWIKPKH